MRRDARVVRRVAGLGVAARRPPARLARDCEPGLHLDHVGRLHGGLHAAARSALVGDDPRHHRHRLADPHLFDRVHARGDRLRVRPLLLVPEPVRRVHARARPRLELPRDVRRLGRRRSLFVPAHRLLVPEEVGLRRRQEGVHRQSNRRLRLRARGAAAVCPLRHRRFPGGGPGGVDAQPGDGIQHRVLDHAAAVCRRDRKVGADPALHLAARRHGRSDAGVGPHSRGDDGDRRACT